jgi:hypothetical protein
VCKPSDAPRGAGDRRAVWGFVVAMMAIDRPHAHLADESLEQLGHGLGWCLLERRLVQQVPASSQGVLPRAIRQQPEMSDAHEAVRDDVQQKPSEEFVGLEGHDFGTIVIRIVPPPEADATVAVIDEPIIRERDAVGVSPKVLEHLSGAGEGALRIHDPVDRAQPTEEAAEGTAIGQRGGATGEGELAGIPRPMQAGFFRRA